MKQRLDINNLRNLTRTRRKTSTTLVEQTIINVQQYFLTNGLHCITIASHEQGRSLLRVCLDSLGIYSNIGIVTVTTKKAPEHYHDIYQELCYAHALGVQDGSLEEFMLSSFHCDFLVLEYTQELLEQPWFGHFEQLIAEYSLAKAIPIVMFLYEDQSILRN